MKETLKKGNWDRLLVKRRESKPGLSIHASNNSGVESKPSSALKKYSGIDRRRFLLNSLSAMLFLLLGQNAHARGNYCRRVNFGKLSFEPNTPLDRWPDQFATRLREIDSQIEVKIILKRSPRELVQLIKSGLLDLALVPANAVMDVIPEWRVLSLPALYPNLGIATQLRQQQTFLELLAQFSRAENVFLVTLAWTFYGIATRTVPIRTPENMKGMKIRAWYKDWKHLFKAANASPIVMPYADVYSALQKGTIDGTVAWSEMFKPLGLEKVIKNLTWSTEHNIFANALALISNKWFWDKTGKNLQPKLLQIASESASIFEESYQKASINAVGVMRKAGVNIIELTKNDFKKWMELSEDSAWKWFEQDVDAGKELLKIAQRVQQPSIK